MALVLIFSGHPGDTESHRNKRRERKLLSSLRARLRSVRGCFLLFLPQNNLSTSGFLRVFSARSLIFMSSSRGKVQFILKRKTRLMPSLYTPSFLLSLHFISALSLICLCVSSFFPVPVDKPGYLCASACVCERIRTSQGQPGEKDVLVHF